MQNPLFKKPEDANYSQSEEQRKFTADTHSGKELLQKELDVNLANQNLLQKRILMMTDSINNIPSSDPQYSMMAIQVQMDRIELDELKSREQEITHKLSKH